MSDLPLNSSSAAGSANAINLEATVTVIAPIQFENAICIVDDVSGTEEVTRTVETETKYHLKHDMPSEIYETIHADDITVAGAITDYIATIAAWLEPDGSLHDAPNHCFIKHPLKIADKLVEYGHTWVYQSWVWEAQQLRRGKQA